MSGMTETLGIPRENSAILLGYGSNITRMDNDAAERCASAWAVTSSGASYHDWNNAYGAMLQAISGSGRNHDSRKTWKYIKGLIPGEVRIRNSLTSPIYNAARAMIVRDLIGQYGFTQAHYDIMVEPVVNAGLLDPKAN